MHVPRPPVRLLLVLAAVVAAVVGLVGPAAAAAPACSTPWGSAAEGVAAVPPTGATLTNVRAGRHACYDRLVLDVRGPALGRAWYVHYVPRVIADPSGLPVPLRGGAFLEVTAGVSDHTDAGVPTYRPANRKELVPVAGYQTFRQVAWAGSFEGLTTIGVGVRARLPFRVQVVRTGASSGQLVLDVAHRW